MCGIGHFQVPKSLTFKMRLGAEPFLWQWVLFAWEWKVISISKAKSTYPRFETKARGNSEMASYWFVFCLRTTDLACNQLKTHTLVGKTKARAANLKSLLFTSNASIDSCVCSAEFGSTGNPFLTAYSCAPWPTSILWGEFSITCLATASGFATLLF